MNKYIFELKRKSIHIQYNQDMKTDKGLKDQKYYVRTCKITTVEYFKK